MSSKRLLIILLVAALLTGCAAALYTPLETDALRYNVPLDSLRAGRQLYVNKCGNCHNLYLPSSHTGTEWKRIINEMQSKAKVNDNQKELMLQYLRTNEKK